MRARQGAVEGSAVDAIGVDIGGTTIVGAVVDPQGQLITRCATGTPSRPQDVVPVVCELIARLRQDRDVAAVGLAAAGFVDAAGDTVLFAKHIGWVDEPLKRRVQHVVGLPVVVENDANAAAWGEARFGGGRGEHCVVCVTVGTGIGGGIVVDGELFRGSAGVAAELGHLCVVPDGLLCGCGGHGCWEMYGSGTALVREARRHAAAGSPLTKGLITSAGSVDAIRGPLVTSAALSGDPGAIELLARLGDWIGRGLASLAAVLDPNCFVVGGGVADAGELLLGPARAAFERNLSGRRYRPRIRTVGAVLGNDAGVIGVSNLALRAA